jgi:hypothetical protein
MQSVVCLPLKMEPIEGSETSAFTTQTPRNYPKENILHKEQGESLKSRMINRERTPLFPLNYKIHPVWFDDKLKVPLQRRTHWSLGSTGIVWKVTEDFLIPLCNMFSMFQNLWNVCKLTSYILTATMYAN